MMVYKPFLGFGWDIEDRMEVQRKDPPELLSQY